MTTSGVSPFRQPAAVWAVAFACVVSFMGIGLVDPILPALAEQLDASPSQVSLLFTSYLLVTAVAMLVTGWVSSRIGTKYTMMAGLSLIIVFSALAGSSGTINEIVGFRAGWGLGNAFFIATSLAVIVGSASGGFAGAIVLYETALGLGIAIGPLLGGELGSISWRGPFFGVTMLMTVALVATVALVRPAPRPPVAQRVGLLAPIRALRHRGLLVMSMTAVFYNWGFFTLLAYSPFPMHLGTHELGYVFTGWGVMVALFSVFVAPRLQRRFGTVRTLYVNLALLSADLLVMALFTDSQAVLVAAVIIGGAFLGVNNTLVTQAVMVVSPVERPVASAAYGFVRFIGGGLAPYTAGKLAEHVNAETPFYVGAGAVLVSVAVLASGARLISQAEQRATEPATTTSSSPTPTAAGTPVPTAVAGAAASPATARSAGGAARERPILLAIDSSPFAGRLTAVAGRLARMLAAPVEVLHVQEVDVVGEDAVEAESAAVARETLGTVVADLAAHGLVAHGNVLRTVGDHADVGHALAAYARQVTARLVVLGGPGAAENRSGLTALTRAGLSEQFWREAQCHALVVNPRAPEPPPAPDSRPVPTEPRLASRG